MWGSRRMRGLGSLGFMRSAGAGSQGSPSKKSLKGAITHQDASVHTAPLHEVGLEPSHQR